MRKENETDSKEKSVSGCSRNTFYTNQLISLGGNSNGLSAFYYAEKSNDLQCDLCRPPLSKGRAPAKLCASCTANAERIEAEPFEHLRQNRKVIRLHRCFACNGCFAPRKFSPFFGICKSCLDRRDEPTAARRKFAARATGNISRIFKGAEEKRASENRF